MQDWELRVRRIRKLRPGLQWRVKTTPLPSAMAVLFLHNALPAPRRPANDRRRRVTHPLGIMVGSLPRGIVRPHPIEIVDSRSTRRHNRMAGDGRRPKG